MRIDEVRIILTDAGWEIDNVVGSHYSFVRGIEQLIIVSHKKKVGQYYLKRVIDAIDDEINNI